MALRLVLGPVRSGKIGVVAARVLAELERGGAPLVVAPTVPEASALEAELCRRAGAILGGAVVTFDGLADLVLQRAGGAPPAPSDALRALLLRRFAAARRPESLAGSARFAGFAAALGRFADECAAAGIDPDGLASSLGADERLPRGLLDAARLYGEWAQALAGAGRLDRQARLAETARRIGSRLEAWPFTLLAAYGFDDLTEVQLAVLRAAAERAEAVVALPWEPGRPAFATAVRAVEALSGVADEVEELRPPPSGPCASLQALERGLFSDRTIEPPAADDGGVRLIEVAGAQGEAAVVAAELASLLRTGVEPDDVIVAVPSPERARGGLEPALAALGVPVVFDARAPLSRTPLGHALLGLLRFAWLEGTREQLFAWLRSPASGLARAQVDSWEGRIRGRGRREPAAVYELLVELRGGPLPAVEQLRSAQDPLAALVELLEQAAPAAFGLDAVPREGDAALQVRAWRAARTTAESLRALDPPPAPDELVAALEAAQVRVGDDRACGRVRVVGYRRARTHRPGVLVALGLEERRFPQRERSDPFLADEARSALAARGVALMRRDAEASERFAFYAALSRARDRVVLVRRATTDDGAPLAASPFWEEVRRVLGSAAPAVERHALGELTHPLERAPSERERLRALAALASEDSLSARRIAARDPGWLRRLDRAQRALSRASAVRDPELVAWLGERRRYSVSELEAFVDCSQRWFVERALAPREIDAEVDAKTRGSVAHAALQRFYARLPAALGAETFTAEQLGRAEAVLREAIRDSMGSLRLPAEDIQVLELGRRMERDLYAFLRSELELPHGFVPRDFEVSFGGEVVGGLPLEVDGDAVVLSGRIDRIDRDPLAARALVQDYKHSRRAQGASDIARERRLQLPLYIEAVRELLGLEAVGGVYRALGGGGAARGLLLADEGIEGFARGDYLAREDFERAIADALEDAREAIRRMRRGDVRHDPRQGSCPAWCEAHAVCRIASRV